jgi:hypothetical protein
VIICSARYLVLSDINEHDHLHPTRHAKFTKTHETAQKENSHFVFVFPAQKVEKSLAVAPTAPYTELLPPALRQNNALKRVRTDLQVEAITQKKVHGAKTDARQYTHLHQELF